MKLLVSVPLETPNMLKILKPFVPSVVLLCRTPLHMLDSVKGESKIRGRGKGKKERKE